MFKVIDLAADGKPGAYDDDQHVAPAPADVVRWVDLVGPQQADLDLLRDRFGFHPLALEDCASFDTRSKFQPFDDFLFVVLHTFSTTGDTCDVQTHELHSFVTETTLVTVHEYELAAVTAAWQRAATDAGMLRKGPAWALYLCADGMTEQVFPVLDRIADEIDGVEEAVLTRAVQGDLAHILELKHTLIHMRRIMGPLRDVIGDLSRADDPRVGEKAAIYFRSVYDHVFRCAERVDAARDLLANALDLYHTVLSNRLNQVMKSLTIMSAIFLPLAFVTGFWGQNFLDLPIGSHAQFASMLASLLVIPAGLLWWFRRNGWF